jgi:hypothetical protein
VLDAFGRVVVAGGTDKWEGRSGVALALHRLSPYLAGDRLTVVFDFYLTTALADRRDVVQRAMLDAALQAINDHGLVSDLLFYHTQGQGH